MRPPLWASEVALAVYLASVVLLNASAELVRISNIIGAGLVVVLIAELAIRQRASLALRHSAPLMPLIAFNAIMAMSTVWEPRTFDHLVTNVQILILFSAVYLIVLFTRRTTSLEVGLLCGLSYIWWTGSWEFTERYTRFQFSISGEDKLNPNAYAFYLCVCICLAIHYVAVEFRSKCGRTVLDYLHLGISSVVITLAAYDVIFRTGSRKGQIAVIVAAAGFVAVLLTRSPTAMTQRATLQRLGLAICLSCAMCFGLYHAFAASRHTERLGAAVGFLQGKRAREVSLANRYRLYTRAIHMWLQKPLVGNGAQAFARKSGFRVYSHSNVTEILCNHGLIGLAAFYSLHGGIVLRLRRCHRRLPDARARVTWVAVCLAVLLVFELFAVFYDSKSFMAFLALLVGISYGDTLRTAVDSFPQARAWSARPRATAVPLC